MNPSRVLLLQLSERTSAKGNRYLSGWLGKASVVAFRGEDDKHGNPTWDVFVSEPQPRTDQRPLPLEREALPAGGSGRDGAGHGKNPPNGGFSQTEAAKPSARQQRPESVTARSPARYQGQGDGWRGSQHRRPANGARRAPVADDTPFYDDDLADIGRR